MFMIFVDCGHRSSQALEPSFPMHRHAHTHTHIVCLPALAVAFLNTYKLYDLCASVDFNGKCWHFNLPTRTFRQFRRMHLLALAAACYGAASHTFKFEHRRLWYLLCANMIILGRCNLCAIEQRQQNRQFLFWHGRRTKMSEPKMLQ